MEADFREVNIQNHIQGNQQNQDFSPCFSKSKVKGHANGKVGTCRSYNLSGCQNSH